MNSILETLPHPFFYSMGFIIFHIEEWKQSRTIESRAIEIREEKTSIREEKGREDRRRKGAVVVAASRRGDKQKDRSVAGNIRVK